MKPRAWRLTLALTAVSTAVACGDRDLTQPTQVAGSLQLSNLTSTGPGEIVGLLKRTDDLPLSLAITKVIGPHGGHIQLNRAGLRVEFAPGAVAVPTPITVTALPGRNVAYTFEPHGLVFSAPVTVSQHLHRTIAWKIRSFLCSFRDLTSIGCSWIKLDRMREVRSVARPDCVMRAGGSNSRSSISPGIWSRRGR